MPLCPVTRQTKRIAICKAFCKAFKKKLEGIVFYDVIFNFLIIGLSLEGPS